MGQTFDREASAARVLILDDDGDFRRFMKLMLLPTGAAIVAVRDICSLLALRPRSDDVVFIDLVMPSLDGIQVLGELARYQVRSKIVLMSGRSADVLAIAARIGRSLGLHIGGVLKKPFRINQLRSFIVASDSVAVDRLSGPLRRPIVTEDLRHGMQNGEIQIVLQPIVEIASGKPWAFEALARWHSEKQGLVHPKQFLPLAAGAGMMPALAETVVRLAVEQSALLKTRGCPSKVCVNFDSAELAEPSLPDKLLSIVEEFGLSPASLVIELTESKAATDQVAMMENLARLRIQGFDLAIDDFGTAYSSLDRIRNLPFSILKIDRSFVCDVETDVRARGIVTACIALARRCKLATVAEGVETRGQLEALKRMGCDMAQGYWIARPMVAVGVLPWLEARAAASRTPRSVAGRRHAMVGSV
jgi:EAL domain-containing protein (putative c-di-GMP-specific phosphodiesterase class I)/FixJ family two-component response regulator